MTEPLDPELAGSDPSGGTDHDELRALIGSLLLGGAPAGDEERLARHLTACLACRAELTELQGVVDLLALADPRHRGPAPPTSLKRQVLASGAATHHRQRLRRRVLAIAAAAVLAGVAITGAVQLVRNGDNEKDQVALQLRAPGSASSGQAQLRQREADISIELDLRRLAPAVDSQTYEVWLVHDGGRVSAGTFRPASDGAATLDLTVAGRVSQYDRIGVTIEPDDLDPARNGETVLTGRLWCE